MTDLTQESREGMRAALLHAVMQDSVDAMGDEHFNDERAVRAVMSAIALYVMLGGDMGVMILNTMTGVAAVMESADPDRKLRLHRRSLYLQSRLAELDAHGLLS